MLRMGHRTYGNPRVETFGKDALVSIGSYCSISNEVVFLAGGEHHVEYVTTFPMTGMRGTSGRPNVDISVGSDVWIGWGATILAGVTIGNGVVVGARAVVRESVPDYAIVAGVPARIKRFRFNPGQISKLMQIKWWDWPSDKVDRYADLLMSSDIDRFIEVAMKEV